VRTYSASTKRWNLGDGQGSLRTNSLIPVLRGHEGCKGDREVQHKRDNVRRQRVGCDYIAKLSDTKDYPAT